MRSKRVLLIGCSLISMCAIGCISTHAFKQIPMAPSDFNRPYEELTQTYPEIGLYEKRFRISHNHSLASDLVAVWSQPDAIKTNIWIYPGLIGFEAVIGSIADLSIGSMATIIGGVFLLIPGPQKNYFWIKGDYCIDAMTTVSVGSLYQRTVANWTWTDIHDSEMLSDDCKELVDKKQRGILPAQQQALTDKSSLN